MKTKRFVSISLALCLVLILGQNVAFAFDSDAAAQRYVGLVNKSVALKISSAGLSTSQGLVEVDSRYTAKATLELQQKKNGAWQPIKSWADSGADAFSIVKDYYVLHGYDYRAVLTVRVYDSKKTLIETGSTSSNTYYY